jgi:hypothetical protein
MNFFVFNMDDNRIQATPQIWIYFAASGGLTLLTLVMYYGVARRFKFDEDPSVDRPPRTSLRRRFSLLAEKVVPNV